MLPRRLAVLADDFNWLARDYDGLRLFMLEELAARFPERTRWTPADLEVALVEVLAAVLDQLSDMADRVAAEAWLATARRPESVRSHLELIGYDPVNAENPRWTKGDPEDERALLDLWRREPHRMEAARRAGPRGVNRQKRMASVDDCVALLEAHPLVLRAAARPVWTGSWQAVRIAAVLWNDVALDKAPAPWPQELRDAVDLFHQRLDLPMVAWTAATTARTMLHPYLELQRMAGQEITLEDARPVGIALSLSVRVASPFFQSEVRRAIEQRLGRGPGGFFRPGRLRFGEDMHASDVMQSMMSVDGVESVCLNRFKRVGRDHPDESARGRIGLDGLEIAVCDNDPNRPERGWFQLRLHGGRAG
jgi:hypothetical protein